MKKTHILTVLRYPRKLFVIHFHSSGNRFVFHAQQISMCVVTEWFSKVFHQGSLSLIYQYFSLIAPFDVLCVLDRTNSQQLDVFSQNSILSLEESHLKIDHSIRSEIMSLIFSTYLASLSFWLPRSSLSRLRVSRILLSTCWLRADMPEFSSLLDISENLIIL